MELVNEFLSNGQTLWKAAAAEYQKCSGESEERDPREMEKYWRFKMCNNYKKPTGSGDAFLLRCLGIARQIMGKSSATVLEGSSGDEELCAMMGCPKDDEGEDGNSSKGDGSRNQEFDDNNDKDLNNLGLGEENYREGEEDGEGEQEGEENHPSLFVGDFAATRSTALVHQLSAFRSPHSESAPPQVGPDGFCPLTFGNNCLT
jgi:hypothetical protein